MSLRIVRETRSKLAEPLPAFVSLRDFASQMEGSIEACHLPMHGGVHADNRGCLPVKMAGVVTCLSQWQGSASKSCQVNPNFGWTPILKIWVSVLVAWGATMVGHLLGGLLYSLPPELVVGFVLRSPSFSGRRDGSLLPRAWLAIPGLASDWGWGIGIVLLIVWLNQTK